jgi:hypothetical protein
MNRITTFLKTGHIAAARTRPGSERMRRAFAKVMRRSCTADTISGL